MWLQKKQLSNWWIALNCNCIAIIERFQSTNELTKLICGLHMFRWDQFEYKRSSIHTDTINPFKAINHCCNDRLPDMFSWNPSRRIINILRSSSFSLTLRSCLRSHKRNDVNIVLELFLTYQIRFCVKNRIISSCISYFKKNYLHISAKNNA